ncbi:MAG TPA: ABC transporter ATP-binding protein [Opitutaceae bacterium]|nr:ABC transporter ATP-binding protein [Opitutaceae bacterium]
MRRFRPYFRYLRPHRGLLALGILCGVISGVATGAGLPLMTNTVFPVIFSPAGAPLTHLQLFLIALWLPAVFVVRGVAGYFNTYVIQLVGTRVLEGIRLDFFRKLQLLPLSFLQRSASGDLLSRGLADANQLQFTLTTAANELIKSPATLLGAIGFVAVKAYHVEGVTLALVALAVVPACVLPVRYVGKKLIRRAGQIQKELGTVTDRMSENLSAAKEVRAFSLEQREIERFSLGSRALIRAQMKFFKYEKALTPLIEIISAVGISVTLLYCYRVHLDQTTFVTLITAIYACYDPIKKLGGLNNEWKRGLGALDRLEEVLNAPLEIADPPQPVAVGRLRGDIAFERVAFAYGSNGDVPALRGVAVVIPAGTVCALVGPSGAGKSTFANLVARFYDVGSGAVMIDGLDVRAMRLADLRRNIALVSQDPVLFNDTVYNNLLLGRAGASRDAVMAAAIDAHADEFIRALPQGYDTGVGERGALLSGGQKQRIAVARAFLRNAPILILDEATSALDSESEAAIQDALRKLVVGKTVIIIAHRFSTIRVASLILVFDRGEIVAQGTHAALYADNALYKSLYDRQHTGAV